MVETLSLDSLLGIIETNKNISSDKKLKLSNVSLNGIVSGFSSLKNSPISINSGIEYYGLLIEKQKNTFGMNAYLPIFGKFNSQLDPMLPFLSSSFELQMPITLIGDVIVEEHPKLLITSVIPNSPYLNYSD